MANDTLSVDTHFEFGANWSSYADTITDEKKDQAKQDLLALIPEEAFAGASFLDIGSGSGIHSLAAAQLGVSSITAVDLDPQSVATTKRVLASYEGEARVEERSVFDLDDLGQFDIVYSWGVLHHTGDMWRAIRCAADRVRPGGVFAIAIYQKTPLCGFWKVEKRAYVASPKPLRRLADGVFMFGYMAGLLMTGRNPVRYVREYKNNRGMNYTHDVRDWLGGYPYESAKPDEIRTFVEGLGFESVKIGDPSHKIGVFGTGCTEYVFRRPTDQISA